MRKAEICFCIIGLIELILGVCAVILSIISLPISSQIIENAIIGILIGAIILGIIELIIYWRYLARGNI